MQESHNTESVLHDYHLTGDSELEKIKQKKWLAIRMLRIRKNS